MMLLAMSTGVKLLTLALAGILIFKLAGCGFRSAPGMLLKTLGIVAVFAGLGLLLTRSGRVEDTHSEEVRISHKVVQEIEFPESFVRGDFVDVDPLRDHPHAMVDQVTVAPNRAMFIILGSGLVILGAILFGRERTRPFALKAITFLGVGAILFSVVNYFGDPPRATRTHRFVGSQSRENVHRQVRKPSKIARATRAKRPSLRPERPAPGEAEQVALPPRAGEIPVTVEVETVPEHAELKVAVAIAEAPAAVATPEAPAASPDVPSTQEAPGEKAPQPSTVTAATAVVEAKPASNSPDSNDSVTAKPSEAVASSEPAAPAVAAEDGESRPDWIDAVPGLRDGVYSLTVNSGPYVSVPECQRALDEELKAAADHYINEYLGDEHASMLVSIPLAYLKRHVKKAEFAEIVQSQSVGPMYQLHARLEFDEQARADFQRQWRNAVVQDRLWYTGGGAALVLALLGTFYGYLRLDLRTDASHKGRLQLAATLVALIVAAGALLARWAVPF